MPNTTTDAIVHEYFCKPTGERDEIRTERFTAPRYGADGIYATGGTAVERCLECGAATYDGVPENQLGNRRSVITPAPPPPAA